MRLGYLYSRYPVISQTFCDSEMLALERSGFVLEVASVYSPLTSLRHEHISRLRAPIHYAPPQQILRIWEKKAKADGSWPAALVELHENKFGPHFKAEQRARNALYFARRFARNVETSSLGQVAPSTSRKIGSAPRLLSKRSTTSEGVMLQPLCGW